MFKPLRIQGSTDYTQTTSRNIIKCQLININYPYNVTIFK